MAKIFQIEVENSVDYTIVKSMPDKYVGEYNILVLAVNEEFKHQLPRSTIFGRFEKLMEHTLVSHEVELSFIAKCIIQLVSNDLSIPIKALVKEVVTRFGYKMMYRKAWTAKQIAKSQIYVLRSRYNCKICIASRHEDPRSLILDCVFWAFKSCIEGLVCRILILQTNPSSGWEIPDWKMYRNIANC
ncbi:hypothetical protein Lal_00036644 [Lupinus albus]|nr:hypothetical protein Lal_00036644 [Lupinus albus]